MDYKIHNRACKSFDKVIDKKTTVDQNIQLKVFQKSTENLYEKEELIFCPLGGSAK